MKEKNKVATTVKIPEALYDDLKVLGIRHKISLQTLVEKCVNLFVENTQVSASFREVVTTYSIQTNTPTCEIVSSGSVTITPLPKQS